MSGHKLVVFDCDGTLVDSQRVIVDCMQTAFAAEALAVPSAEAIRRIVGLSLVQAIERLLDERDIELAGRLAEHYRGVFMARRLADKAKQTGRPVTLSPMSPRDRRIVHLALQEDTTIATRSQGQGYYRKLLILPTDRARRPARQNRPAS